MVGIGSIEIVVGFNNATAQNLVPALLGEDDVAHLHIVAEFPRSEAGVLITGGCVTKLLFHGLTHGVQALVLTQITNLFPADAGDAVLLAALPFAGVLTGSKNPVFHGSWHINGGLCLLCFEIVQFLDEGDIGEFGVIGEIIFSRGDEAVEFLHHFGVFVVNHELVLRYGDTQVLEILPAIAIQREINVWSYPEQANCQVILDEELVLECIVCILDGFILHGGHKDIPQTLDVPYLAVFLKSHEVGLHRIDDGDTVVVLGNRNRNAEALFEFRADNATVLVRDAPVEDGEHGERIYICDTAAIGIVFQMADVALKVIVNPINERLSVVSVRQEFLG